MPNRNAYLGVLLDERTMSALGEAVEALAACPSALLGAPEGEEVSFNLVEEAARHMTFVFFGEQLRQLPAEELRAFYAALQRELRLAAAEGAGGAPMTFCGFQFFPPGKANLVVACFEPTPQLKKFRDSVLKQLKELAVTLPQSFFAQLEGEGAWTPHVTLGKIGASKAQLGRLSCRQEALQALAPRSPALARGLTLLGERPLRVWCDWDEGLLFEAQPDEGELERPEEAVEEETEEG